MTTSNRSFNQVKNILSKLDRRIDDLREQRTSDRVIGQGVAPAPVPAVPAPQPQQPPLTGAAAISTPSSNPLDSLIGLPKSQPQPAQQTGVPAAARPGSQPQPAQPNPANQPRSPYGRATPIRPTGA